ncbi:MAG: LCP family protein [Microgenomates group bacterium]
MDETNPVPKKLDKKVIVLSRLKRKILKHIWLVRAGLIVLVFLGFYLIYLCTSFLLGRLGITNYTRLISDFIFTPSQKIQTTEGRTNLLILGKGGQGHEAPDLTDTVIFASISHQNPLITLISLPRDIWISELRAKLNSAYYWGNQKQAGGGLILAKSTVEEIVGEPVHYGVVVDFSGFMRIIDVLGGIEVYVERTFVDEKYPIPGKEDDDCDGDPEYSCRYETIRFEKGKQIMDGETALKFARSRNAEGDEGTDLARTIRQQKILLTIREEILAPKTFLSPKKMLAVWQVVRESTETDINASAGAILARKALQGSKQISSHVLSEDLLVNPPIQSKYDNLYVFVPRKESWQEVRGWIKEILSNN